MPSLPEDGIEQPPPQTHTTRFQLSADDAHHPNSRVPKSRVTGSSERRQDGAPVEIVAAL